MHSTDALNNAAAVRAVVYANASSLLDVTEAAGFDATMGIHAALFEELFALRPEARVIVMERDFDSMYESFAYMYERLADPSAIGSPVRFPQNLLPSSARLVPAMRFALSRMGRETDDCLMGVACRFRTPEHRARLKRGMDLRDQFIRTHVPPDQVLRFRLGTDGYPELCAFLGVPADRCPADPFPHINSKAEFEAIYRLLVAMELLGRGAVVAVLILAAIGLRACVRSRTKTTAPAAVGGQQE